MLPLFPIRGIQCFFPGKWDFGSFKKRLTVNVWSRIKADVRVREIRTRLPGVIKDLDAACREVEPEFVRIGQGLQGIYGDTRELTQQVLDSVKLIGGKDEEGVLFHLAGLGEASLVKLRQCQEDVTEKTAVMQSVVGHLSGLSDACRTIEKVGLLLRVVAVNIGIESARSVESSELFSVVAQDTGNLSEKIRATMADGLDVLNKAWVAQQSLHTNLCDGLQEINRLGGSARSIVQEAVREIETLMETTRHFVEQAGEHSGRIYRQVGDLVMAVQFHDSMSQRVEHITKALVDAERFLDGDGSNNGGADHGRRLSHALSLMRLQAAQLREIISELERVHEKSHHSFQEILRGSRALVEDLSEITSNRRPHSGPERVENDPLKRLESSFGKLNRVLHSGQDLMDGVKHAASRASETVDQISKCVREMHTMGFETHLMALNAIVKAAHLGHEGGAIEVLAHEVKQSSVQSRSVLARASELLDHVTTAAGRLRDKNDEDTSSNLSFESALEEITLAYQQFTDTTGAAHGRADEITAVIGKTKAHLDFLPLLVERFTESLYRMEAIIQDLSPFAAGAHDLVHEDTGDILKRYTMEKEREIHENSLYGGAVSADPKAVAQVAPGAPQQGPGINEPKPAASIMDDNIELFSGDVGSSREAIGHIELFTDEAPEQADETWENVELSDADPGPAEGSAVMSEESAFEEKKEKEDLGDNVELF